MFQLNDKFCLVAKTKSGKSYLGKVIQKAYPRKIIIDTTYEYAHEDGEILYGFNNFIQRVSEIQELPEYTLIFRFNHEDHDHEKIFEQICRVVFYLQDTFFVVEEIHLHSSVHNINPWLLKIATIGSHQGIGYLLTTQRPSLIHKTLLTQCDHIFIGCLIDFNDINYVKAFCGEYSKQLTGFPARKFIYWNHTAIKVLDTNNMKI